jgi:phospholipid/cholesterol/gamma-HCH transport system substrate-binding protein
VENKNEILVGALTVFGIAAFILGFKFLQGDDIFSRSQYINVVADRTSNITLSNAVLENGVPIGRVDNIVLSNSPNYLHKAIMTLKLESNVQIPANSTFVIYGVDNLGKMAIGLNRGDGTTLATEKDTLKCLTKGDPIAQISDLANRLGPGIDSTLTAFKLLASNLNTQLGTGENALLKNAVSDLRTTLVSVNKLAGNADKMIVNVDGLLTGNKKNIDGLLKNLNTLTSESGKLDSILTNFQSFSGKLNSLELESVLTSAKTTLEELKKTLKIVNDGDGTISKLLKEDGAYQDITKTLQSLNAVITDLKANPKKYISLSLIDRSRTITTTDTSIQQFLENNPKAAKKVNK